MKEGFVINSCQFTIMDKIKSMAEIIVPGYLHTCRGIATIEATEAAASPKIIIAELQFKF